MLSFSVVFFGFFSDAYTVGWAKYQALKKAREEAAVADEDNEENTGGPGPGRGARGRGGDNEERGEGGEGDGGESGGGGGSGGGSGKKKKSKKEGEQKGEQENEGPTTGNNPGGEVGVDDSGWGNAVYWLNPFSLGNTALRIHILTTNFWFDYLTYFHNLI